MATDLGPVRATRKKKKKILVKTPPHLGPEGSPSKSVPMFSDSLVKIVFVELGLMD